MNESSIGVLLSVCFFICLAIAGAYLYFWPKPRDGAPTRPFWLHFILRWFHSLVWIFLAFACIAGMLVYPRTAKYLALAGLYTYGVFLCAFVYDRARK